MKIFFPLIVVLWVLSSAVVNVQASEPGAPTGTLWYEATESVVFYNEVKVLRSVPSSYFCASGWQGGYFGIQELKDGAKVVIFSVWDSDNDNPASVPEADRVKAVEVGHAVRIGRFGNEGSGGQSFFDYSWKNGVTYSFVVTAKKKNKRMEYSAFFRAPEMKGWYFIATFSTLYSPKYLTALYSFMEDFERSPASEEEKREAVYSNGWVQFVDGTLGPLNKAQFSADRKTTSLDAAPTARGFRMAIGGDTELSVPLDSRLQWKQEPGSDPPANFPK